MSVEAYPRVSLLAATSYSNPILCLWGSLTTCVAGTIFGKVVAHASHPQISSSSSSSHLLLHTSDLDHEPQGRSTSDHLKVIMSESNTSWPTFHLSWLRSCVYSLTSWMRLFLSKFCFSYNSATFIQATHDTSEAAKIYAHFSSHVIRAVYAKSNGHIYALVGDLTCQFWSSETKFERWRLHISLHPSDQVMYVVQHASSLLIVSSDTFYYIKCLCLSKHSSCAGYFLEKDTIIFDLSQDYVAILIAPHGTPLCLRVARIPQVSPGSTVGYIEPVYEYSLYKGGTLSYLLFWGHHNIVMVRKERCICALSWRTGTELFTIQNAHATEIVRLDTSCPQRLISISQDGNIRVWQLDQLIFSLFFTNIFFNNVVTTRQMQSFVIDDRNGVVFAADMGLYLFEWPNDSLSLNEEHEKETVP